MTLTHKFHVFKDLLPYIILGSYTMSY